MLKSFHLSTCLCVQFSVLCPHRALGSLTADSRNKKINKFVRTFPSTIKLHDQNKMRIDRPQSTQRWQLKLKKIID